MLRLSGVLFPENGGRAERRLARTVATAFAVFGSLWILLTDTLLYRVVESDRLAGRLETAKGWAFVLATSLFIYAATRRATHRLSAAQATLAAVFDSIADGVLLLGPNRTIAHANPAAVRFLGCKHRDDLVGMDATQFARRFRVSYPSGALVPPERFVSQRVFDEPGPLQYKAIVHPTAGSERVISVTAASVAAEPGVRPEMVVSVMHDITASHHLERLRDEFFAAAAHALKTPVAIVKANAQLLGRTSDGRQHRTAGAIERQCARIDLLVQNLLVLSRSQSGTLRLYPREVALRPLLEVLRREIGSSAPGRELRSDLGAQVRVFGDEERLSLVVRNVIDEAIRSSAPGSAITMRLTQHGEDAEIDVVFRALPPEKRAYWAGTEYDDLRIGHNVAEILVEAHGGALQSETVDDEIAMRIVLPTTEARHGAV